MYLKHIELLYNMRVLNRGKMRVALFALKQSPSSVRLKGWIALPLATCCALALGTREGGIALVGYAHVVVALDTHRDMHSRWLRAWR